MEPVITRIAIVIALGIGYVTYSLSRALARLIIPNPQKGKNTKQTWLAIIMTIVISGISIWLLSIDYN